MTEPQGGREYFAHRRGRERPRLSYEDLRRLIVEALLNYERDGWFQLGLGKNCVDDQKDIGAYVIEKLDDKVWPLGNLRNADEDWLFSAIEFLYDHVAKPTNSYTHRWDDCGIHVTSADVEQGRAEFAERINGVLVRYAPFELRESGEIWGVAPSGLEDLHVVPTGEPDVDDRVQSAISRFRRHGANVEEKHHAVRDLADVIEYLRKSLKDAIPSKDEGYLFDIANNFGIRHHNSQQRTDYDEEIWLDWIFYAFLNTIAMTTRILARE